MTLGGHAKKMMIQNILVISLSPARGVSEGTRDENNSAPDYSTEGRKQAVA
jgi:hypothetical protein